MHSSVRCTSLRFTPILVALVGTLAFYAAAANAQQITLGTDVNTDSKNNAGGAFVMRPQFEPTISINQKNPLNVVAYSITFAPATNTDNGLYKAVSNDGGKSWTSSLFANGGGGIPGGFADPTSASDSFGDQFVAYMDTRANTNVILTESTDGGQTYNQVGTFTGVSGTGNDQPTVVTGPGPTKTSSSVWLSWRNSSNQIVASGAMISGAGAANVGNFTKPVAMLDPSGNAFTTGINYGDIAVGPGGSVAVTYQNNLASKNTTNSNVYVNASTAIDYVKQSASFGNAVIATSNGLGGSYSLSAVLNKDSTNNDQGADAEAGLAWDHSGGASNGNLYLVYTVATALPGQPNQTQVRYLTSKDGGQTWVNSRAISAAVSGSSFEPRIAVDQTTGNVAASWYDTRADATFATTQYFADLSLNGGASFGNDFLVSNLPAGAQGPPQPPANIGLNRSDTYSYSATFNDNNNAFGDYSALDFYQGVFRPAWIDNSNNTLDNPFGNFAQPNLYTIAVSVPEPTTLALLLLGLPIVGLARRRQKAARGGR
jgi:PEP-CTERM motif